MNFPDDLINPSSGPRTAMVHDWLTGMRGGEKVLEASLEIFHDAKIYTLLHNPAQVSDRINQKTIQTSWLGALPRVHRYYRYLLPLMPHAIGRFDLSGYDLVISFSHCVAKGVRLRGLESRKWPLHICYCFTPMRYIYSQFESYFPNGASRWTKRGAAWIRPHLVKWDQGTVKGVDHFIASSENVRCRIQQAYGRDARVIYPPVDTEFFNRIPTPLPPPSKSYYLVVGALVPYKRVDLAIQACRRLRVPLKVVGVGTELAKLRKISHGAPVEFLGWQPPEALKSLYQNCEALLFPQEEDFGIAAVEAMACGRPVIAYGEGGALETVVEGKTGLFFKEQSAEALSQVIRSAQGMSFDPQEAQARAAAFSREIFKARFSSFIGEVMQANQEAPSGRAEPETSDLSAVPA